MAKDKRRTEQIIENTQAGQAGAEAAKAATAARATDEAEAAEAADAAEAAEVPTDDEPVELEELNFAAAVRELVINNRVDKLSDLLYQHGFVENYESAPNWPDDFEVAQSVLAATADEARRRLIKPDLANLLIDRLSGSLRPYQLLSLLAALPAVGLRGDQGQVAPELKVTLTHADIRGADRAIRELGVDDFCALVVWATNDPECDSWPLRLTKAVLHRAHELELTTEAWLFAYMAMSLQPPEGIAIDMTPDAQGPYPRDLSLEECMNDPMKLDPGLYGWPSGHGPS